MRALLTLLTLAAALPGYRAQELSPAPRLRLCVMALQERPRFFQDDGEWSGFEVHLIEALSNSTDFGFEWVWLDGLQDRVTGLANGTCDLVVAGFRATTTREEAVDFVFPAYYMTGTALFTPEGAAPEGVQTWEDLRGKRVAVLAGFDDGNTAEKLGVELVAVAGAEEAAALIASGQVVGYLADSVNLDMKPTNLKRVAALEPLGPIPVAIAVAQGNTALAQKLSDGLLQLFWNGGGSPLQELEQKWFVAGGLQPNEAVAKLMETLKAGQPADKSGPLFTPYDSNSTTSS